jgi:hypothetical protein
MIFPKYYIGPMSQNVVDCVAEHSRKHCIGLIPSRRQVDFCGGYVNKWDTKTFSYYLKDTNVLLCRDHGGENQGQYPDDGMQSFKEDSLYLDLVHIDPFRVCRDMRSASQKTCEIINYLFDLNPNLMYEVGTEEAIFKYSPDKLREFLSYLQTNLDSDRFDQIKYAVVQSGTGLDLSTRTNTGNFNSRRLKKFVKVVKEFGLMSKEHNGDYLTESFDVEMRFELGLDAINIAPEYGQIESEYYLEMCQEQPDLLDKLYSICYNSKKWEKWIFDISKISKEQMIITCCHYILSNVDFINEIKSHFPDADKTIRQRIQTRLKLLNEQTKNYCL